MPRIRLRVRCTGAVQGVGFRPTVHRLAHELQLAGKVWNEPDGATVEVEGAPDAVAAFAGRLPAELPPLARLDELQQAEIPVTGERGFQVVPSEGGRRGGALVPADAALCAECRSEMDDPGNRRHRYPFTTCTNCGPRFSIVHSLPYDREVTSMACFPLCAACRAEYENPADRRFHAEPVCCPDCGPRLWLCDRTGRELAQGAAAFEATSTALLQGKILALKGLGGFQLVCRADDNTTVDLLRERKRRPSKPFAVMLRSRAEAREVVRLTAADEALLTAAGSPVVLAPRREPSLVSPLVAPGLDDLGIMLPTTPLHVELLRDPRLPALIMTSGNASDEPIARGNREAVERLAGIADLFLLHDRDVVRRVDDSVFRSSTEGPLVVRRSRGWVPVPESLPEPTPTPLLAVGGHLQVCGAVAVNGQAFTTQHVGDLDTESARSFLRETLHGLEQFLEVEARLIVCDAHPDYPSSWLAEHLAEGRGARLLRIQHHLAHGAAVLAEHERFPEPGQCALVLCLDGTGWGPDLSAWGGEWLRLDGDPGWARVAALETLPLVGGERAVREPWRVAVAALGGADLALEMPMAELVDAELLCTCAGLASAGEWPRASGAGRLFEACGALLGLCGANRWEGEAAARLESLAARADQADDWHELTLDEGDGTLPRLPSSALLRAAAAHHLAGQSAARIAASFHHTFARLAAELTVRVLPAGSELVAATGGCMVNRLLRGGLRQQLADRGIGLVLPRTIPCGDGGLAYGQAAVAASWLARGAGPEVFLAPGNS